MRSWSRGSMTTMKTKFTLFAMLARITSAQLLSANRGAKWSGPPESARAVAQDIAMPLRRNIQRTMQVVGATMNSNYQMLGGQSRRDQGDWSACDRAIEYRLLANVPSNIGGS
jgi:hypothetical protein